MGAARRYHWIDYPPARVCLFQLHALVKMQKKAPGGVSWTVVRLEAASGSR
jgi:hypothetical protein